MSDCPQSVNIKGEHVPCDNGDHPGWPHSNREHEIVWDNDDRKTPEWQKDAVMFWGDKGVVLSIEARHIFTMCKAARDANLNGTDLLGARLEQDGTLLVMPTRDRGGL